MANEVKIVDHIVTFKTIAETESVARELCPQQTTVRSGMKYLISSVSSEPFLGK